MTNPLIGEIRMFAGTYAPNGWAFCEGQLLRIDEHDALFAVLGTTHGGDGSETFALPDLRGRLPVHRGALPGGEDYRIGQRAGTEAVVLLPQQIPPHTHAHRASSGLATETNPAGNVAAQTSAYDAYQTGAGAVPMASGSVAVSGGFRPHTNMQPYLCVNFIIALVGVFPSTEEP